MSRKPSFTAALEAEASPPTESATHIQSKAKQSDGRINTTIRISPEGLKELKIVAAEKRVRVNDLLLEGAEYVLSIYGRKLPLRK